MIITRGRTYEASSTFRVNGTATAPGVSDQFRFIVKWKPTDPDTDIVFQCSLGDGIVFSGGTGEFTLTISSSKSSGLPVSDARQVLSYEFIYVRAGTDAFTLDSGTLYVEPAVLSTL